MNVSEATATVPLVDTDMTTWEFNQDPYPVLAAWRELGPVVFHTRHERYLVTSYRNCARALSDVAHFDSQQLVEFFEQHFGGITMEALDSPRHHDMRGVWTHDFARDTLRTLRNGMITDVVASCVDPFVERVRSGEVVDAVSGMTRGIPTLVISYMLGIEADRYQEFAGWSDAMGRMSEGRMDPSPRGRRLVAESDAGTAAMNGYMAEAIEDRRRGRVSGDDLISTMVQHPFGKTMDDREIVASNTQLVFAGTETTAKLMAATLVALAQHPEQRAALVADRSLIPQAIEEVHRWRTLTQVIPRHASADDSEIDGIHIPCGAQVDLLTGAANHDPDRWDDAASFDIFRRQRSHLGFGFGMHVCLGLSLTRLEAQVWLDQILDQLPDFELAGAIDYGRNFPIRAPVEVLVAAG